MEIGGNSDRGGGRERQVREKMLIRKAFCKCILLFVYCTLRSEKPRNMSMIFFHPEVQNPVLKGDESRDQKAASN